MKGFPRRGFNRFHLFSLGLGFLLAQSLWAQVLVEDGSEPKKAPTVGSGAATDYFRKREKVDVAEDVRDRFHHVVDSDRIMSVYFGSFVNDKSYRWGEKNKVDDPGRWNAGVSYRVGEWSRSMDLYFRAELDAYKIDGQSPLKLSLMPVIAFPDVRSDFPLYFGAGMGVGIYFEQVGEESDISLDYLLLVGTRFVDAFDWGGVFFETGLKGQVLLMSSGQQDGVFVQGGFIFAF